MKYRATHLIEYGLLRVVAFLATSLPYRLALAWGWLFAMLSFGLMRSRMQRAQRRIRQVLGPACTPVRARQVARLAWRNLFFNMIEAIRTPLLTRRWIEAHIDAGQSILARQELDQGKGLIVAVPHMGNWELAGVAMQLLGFPMVTLVRKQKNPLVNAWLNHLREFTGMEAIETRTREVAMVTEYLKKGYVLAILADLRAKTGAVPVQFLGATADIPGGMALFARRAGVKILPSCVRRDGWTRHRWQAFDPIEPDYTLEENADVARITQHVMAFFDRAIRETPEQYFWFNKRWILGADS